MMHPSKELCVNTWNLNLTKKINTRLSPGITRGRKKKQYNEILPTVSKEIQDKVQSVTYGKFNCKLIFKKLLLTFFLCYLEVWGYLLEILAF